VGTPEFEQSALAGSLRGTRRVPPRCHRRTSRRSPFNSGSSHPTRWQQAPCERQSHQASDGGQTHPPKPEDRRIKGADGNPHAPHPLLYQRQRSITAARCSHRGGSFAPKSCRDIPTPPRQLRAMYGRRPRCKRNLTFCEAFGCSHVSGLFSPGGLPPSRCGRCDRWP
jgi:hypothetical protein